MANARGQLKETVEDLCWVLGKAPEPRAAELREFSVDRTFEELIAQVAGRLPNLADDTADPDRVRKIASDLLWVGKQVDRPTSPQYHRRDPRELAMELADELQTIADTPLGFLGFLPAGPGHSDDVDELKAAMGEVEAQTAQSIRQHFGG